MEYSANTSLITTLHGNEHVCTIKSLWAYTCQNVIVYTLVQYAYNKSQSWYKYDFCSAVCCSKDKADYSES